MNEEQLKQIRAVIQEELQSLMGINGFIFQKNIQVLDARNIKVGLTTGTKIATGADQKLGFFGTTPVVQRTTANIGLASFGGGAGTVITTADTFDGYQLQGVVRGLRSLGFLA